MARPENLDLRPHIKPGRSRGGAFRSLPIVEASQTEVSAVKLNGHLNPDATVEELRAYLGVPSEPLHGHPRNSGPR